MKHSQLLALIALPFISSTAFSQSWVAAPMFGNLGAKTVDVLAGEDRLVRGELLPDGKYLMLGRGYDSGCNCNHISMLKLDTLCGALDASFGNGGYVGHIFDQRSWANDMAVMADGRILACGQNAPSNAGSQQVGSVYRFNANGTPDLTMNGTGWRNDRFDAVSSGYNTAVFPMLGDRFCAVGISFGNINGGALGFGIMRYDANGAFDLSYSGDGKAWYPAGDLRSSETALFLPDSSVIAIHGFGPGTTTLHLAKFLADGTLDPNFGSGGQALTALTFQDDPDRRLRAALLPDGRFLIGSTTADGLSMQVACFMPDGSLDASYGNNGLSTANPTAAQDYATGLQVFDDGSTLQFGYTPTFSAVVIKRSADGQIDGSFGTGGVVVIPALATDMNIHGGTMINAGSILLYGRGAITAAAALAAKLTTNPSNGLFADLGPDTGFCPGQSVVLDAGFPGSTYQWNLGFQNLGTTQTINASTGGSYRVAITNADGCTDRDTIQVTAYSAPDIPIIEQFGDELYTTAFPPLQWYLNGEPIPGATEDIWIAVENGTYTVIATDPFTGCTATSPPYQVINTGIEQNFNSVDGITAFPNPFGERISVRATLTEATDVSIALLDITGRSIEVLANPRLLAAGEHIVDLVPMASLSSGSYLLEVRIGDRRTRLSMVH